MSNLSEQLLQHVDDFNLNYAKFKNGNKAAGTRARKALQNLRTVSLDLRKEISEEKNG